MSRKYLDGNDLTPSFCLTTNVVPQHQDKNIGDYYSISCEDILGSSGCGDVVLCTHKITKVNFILKTVLKGTLSTNELVPLRARIARLVALDHPNRVRIFEIFETDEVIHFVVELCRGDNLVNTLRQRHARCYKEQAVIRYIRQILSAVAHGHENGVVHGDLKLENCLFEDESYNSEVKLSGNKKNIIRWY